MTLGEKTTSLRNAQKLSQGDLAEKLNVSRQSVSKWETGASVVTLDELAKSGAITNKALSEPQTIYVVNQHDTRKILAIMLIVTGLLGVILGAMFFTEMLIFALPIVLNGIILLVFKKYAGLTCGWLTVILIYVFLTYSTGSGAFSVFSSLFYPRLTLYSMIAYIFLLLIILMIIFTVKTFKKNK